MTESSYSLDSPLPREIQPSTGSSYLRYPVFGWPWYWRRAAILAPFAIFLGAAISVRAGLDTGTWLLAWSLAFRAVSVWMGIVLLTPLSAVVIRQRAFPIEIERRLVVCVIVIGIVVSFIAKAWYENYYTEVVWPVLKSLGKQGNAMPGMVLNSIETALPSSFFDLFYRVFYAFLILSVGGGLSLLQYFREGRRWEAFRASREVRLVREQRDNADRTLAILQAQVEPHFLYNTLASVRSLVRADPARAEATIDALVDHLRETLPKFRNSQVGASTLADQLEICRSYLEVMRVRTGERMKYSLDVPLDLMRVSFPPLMLISLVENAVKHGIEPKPGSCSILVTAHRINVDNAQSVEVIVSDDGAGLREGPSEGVGLANIRAQLAARYGDRASMNLKNRERGGVAASLVIPLEDLVP